MFVKWWVEIYALNFSYWTNFLCQVDLQVAMVAEEVVAMIIGMTMAMTAVVQARLEALVVPLDVVAVMIGLTTDGALVPALASGATVEDLRNLENRPLVSPILNLHNYFSSFLFSLDIMGVIFSRYDFQLNLQKPILFF